MPLRVVQHTIAVSVTFVALICVLLKCIKSVTYSYAKISIIVHV